MFKPLHYGRKECNRPAQGFQRRVAFLAGVFKKMQQSPYGMDGCLQANEILNLGKPGGLRFHLPEKHKRIFISVCWKVLFKQADFTHLPGSGLRCFQDFAVGHKAHILYQFTAAAAHAQLREHLPYPVKTYFLLKLVRIDHGGSYL